MKSITTTTSSKLSFAIRTVPRTLQLSPLAPRSWQHARSYRTTTTPAGAHKLNPISKSTMATQAALPPAVGGTRFADHFHGKHDSIDTQGLGWCKLWDQDESNLWDRGKPSPPLIALVEERSDIVSPFREDGSRKKALVPGCGRGYDVVMLAQHGFDAYGLEISATAVATANSYSAVEMAAPSSYNFTNSHPTDSIGDVSFMEGDFFERGWEPVSQFVEGSAKFDLIYDYTFLCALIPETRQNWATRMADLLKPDGLLVCLEFPLYKDPTLPGPPWGLDGVHWDLLAEGGDGRLDRRTSPPESDICLDGQFERVLYIKPKESYEMGKGTDMLSVWRRKP